MNLYEITTDLLELQAELEALEGELTPELEARLAINDADFEAKALGYLHVMANVNADVDGLDAEIKRLQARKKAAQSTYDRMKGSIDNALRLRGTGSKITLGTFALSYRKPEAIEIADPDNLPSDYMRMKVEPNKTALKDAIKAGQSIAGVELVTNYSLQVK